MRNKSNSIFLYLLYRTVNYYYEGFVDFNNGKDVWGWDYSGENVFWTYLNAHVYFFICVIFCPFNVDLTFWGNFWFFVIFFFFPVDWFWKKQMPEIRKNFKAWRKKNKKDPDWRKRGWLVSFYYAFILVEWLIAWWIHCYLSK